ncbi:MAG: flagellar basal body protein [Alkalibacterium sp.]|nr:flagellar basal body protein [Alkalibacterium sp.]
MLNSMYSGITGMKGQQTKMDVIANNISNVNTTGFKSSACPFPGHDLSDECERTGT